MSRREGLGRHFQGRALFPTEQPGIVACSFCGRTRRETNLVEGEAAEEKSYICALCAQAALEVLGGTPISTSTTRKSNVAVLLQIQRLGRRLRRQQARNRRADIDLSRKPPNARSFRRKIRRLAASSK